MITGVHHISFVVQDLDAAIQRFRPLLGRAPMLRETLVERGVRTARFALGETWLVLVQPVQSDAPPGRHLEAHGEGFFLLSLTVESLEAEARRLDEAAFSGPARNGLDTWRVRDLDPARLSGAALQLAEDRR